MSELRVSVYSISKVSLKERSMLLSILLNRFQTLKENKKMNERSDSVVLAFLFRNTFPDNTHHLELFPSTGRA